MSLDVTYALSFHKAPSRILLNFERRGLSSSLQPLDKSRWRWKSSLEPHLQWPKQSTSSLYRHLNWKSVPSDAEVIYCCSDKTNTTYFAKGILQAIARALFLVGLGLGASLPASARTVASSVSQVSVAEAQENGKHGVDAVMESGRDVGALQSQEDASFQHDGPVLQSMSRNADMSETDENELRLSDAFWRGLPTADGSFLHSLKVRLNENPSEVQALKGLLQAVLEQKDMLRTLTVVETLLEVQPDNPEWKFLKARTHGFLGEFLMAKQEYDELLSLHPLSARFLQGLAKILNEMGEETQALELIKNALDQAILQGKIVETRNLGLLYGQFNIQLGNFEDALLHLSKMTEEDPDDFRPYLCQGLAYAFMKQKDNARQSFNKYMKLCPPDAFDENYLDSLMLRAQASKRLDTLTKTAMKTSSRNKKKAPKPMKQPSIFGTFKSQHGDDLD